MNTKGFHFFFRSFVWSASLLLLSACDPITQWLEEGEEEHTQKPVARVYDSYLSLESVIEVLPKDLSPEDSAAFVSNFINLWAKDQLMVYKAGYNLPEEQKRFEKQIAAYRNDLLKHSYLQKYISERLDTNISEAEVKAYYEANAEQFQLKENILRVRYMAVPKAAPDLEILKKKFVQIEQEEARKWLQDYALRYARFFVLEDTNWLSFSRFSQMVPIQTYNQQEFLAQNRWISLEEGPLLYLAQILEYKIKDSPSPLHYVYPRVESTLLNQRRLALIQDLEQNLVKDAQKKNQFEIY